MKVSTIFLGGAALFIAAPFLLDALMGRLDEAEQRRRFAEREAAKTKVGGLTP